jgi:hypothetical protein
LGEGPGIHLGFEIGVADSRQVCVSVDG